MKQVITSTVLVPLKDNKLDWDNIIYFPWNTPPEHAAGFYGKKNTDYIELTMHLVGEEK